MIYCVRPCPSFSKRAAPDKQTRAERRTFAMRCSRRFVKLEPTLASGQHDVHETADTVLSLINGVRDEWITRRESTLTCNGCGSSRNSRLRHCCVGLPQHQPWSRDRYIQLSLPSNGAGAKSSWAESASLGCDNVCECSSMHTISERSIRSCPFKATPVVEDISCVALLPRRTPTSSSNTTTTLSLLMGRKSSSRKSRARVYLIHR